MNQTITIPEDYILVQISESEYKIVKKEVKLPESWSEFCLMYKITEKESCIDIDSSIYTHGKSVDEERHEDIDRNILPNKEYAEAILALCQLIQLRDCYRQGWKPNWKSQLYKYCIEFSMDEFRQRAHCVEQHILSFQSEEIRDKFYENFKDLIEKTKPLFM